MAVAGNSAARARERFHHLTNYADTLVSFIWDVADLLRGPYRPPEYRKVMLPMTVLRRLDCVLESTKAKVLEEQKKLKGQNSTLVDKMLRRAAKQQFYNTSKFDFAKLLADPEGLAQNLLHYIKAFSPETRALFDNFGFDQQIAKLDKSNRLFKLVQKFSEVDLHPNVVSNLEMGRSFEELVRKFNEAANEEAGDHFTPREVIRLMVDLIFLPDNDLLRKKGAVRTLYDPAAGTGGMLSEAAKYLRELNPDATLVISGQDYNAEAYAICGSDMLIKGEEIDKIQYGDSLGDGKTFDAFPDKKFDYMLANPPFGVKWESEEDYVRKEHEKQGYEGRFGAGLPRINDGSFLFLQHMISKMKPYSHADQTGSRIGIVFNGSPLFTGDAGSGESNIRKWIIENDWLEGIVALPDQLFYNTGINTYIWIVTNRKTRKRKGKVQLVNAVDLYSKMRKSLGNKRNELTDSHIADIVRIYGSFVESEHSKIFDNEDFGYRKITVERPLRLSFSATPEHLAAFEASRTYEGIATSRKSGKEGKREVELGQALQVDILAALRMLPKDQVWMDREKFASALNKLLKGQSLSISAPVRKAIFASLNERDEGAAICADVDGNPEPDPELRDTENVPLKEDIHHYFEREVKPHVPDAWIDESKTKIGYDILFTQLFFRERPLASIHSAFTLIEQQICTLRSSLDNLADVLGKPDTSAPCSFADVEVPEGWSRSKLGFLATVKARLGWKGLKAEEYVDEGYIFLATPNIKERAIDFENVNYITHERYVESPEIMLEVGDVLIAKDGSTLGTCNVVRHLPAPATVNSSIAVVRPSTSLDSIYLYYLFRSHPFQLLVNRMKGGMGVPHLFQADLRKFEILLPPKELQSQIGRYLDAQTAIVSGLYPPAESLTGASASVEGLLSQLQQSLITAAVTGQLDLREHERKMEALV